jgi:hypothetical protein
MVLTCQQLYDVTIKPDIVDLTLNILREYYETYLNPYIYQFEIIDDVQGTSKSIELRFDQDNFCHLLGIATIVKHTVNRDTLKQYKGQPGWDNIVNGTITLASLKDKKTKKQFNSKKNKYVFFYLIPKLIESPKAVLYDATIVDGNTQIDCEILFYDNLQNSYVHLGIEFNEELGYYRPRTFFVEKITPPHKNGMKYVENQKEINVTKLDKLKVEID